MRVHDRLRERLPQCTYRRRAGLITALTGALVVSVTVVSGAGSASAQPAAPETSIDCSDVQVLAVPGTWETNAQADPNVVPGMLANVTEPLETALTGPAASGPAPGPTSDRTSSTSTPVSGTTTTSVATSTTPTRASAPVAVTRPVKVDVEQVPYVAQVGGPIAGIITGNQLTYAQSKANGEDALEQRANAIAEACPLTKFVILGYSQGSVIAGDFLSKVGNRLAEIDPSRIVAGALLSDPARSPSTPDPNVEPPAATATKLTSVAETMVGPNVSGQGVVGKREKGMGVLAERVTSFCAPGDLVCSASSKSPALAAVMPLLNLTPEDIPDYALDKGLELLKNVASANPQDMQKAVTSVITQMTRLTLATAVNPTSLPMELARVVFASTMLDDIARVVDMPEFDALVSLTHPDQLISQVTQMASYLLLDAHRSYGSYPVDQAGDTATQWVVKWVTAKVQAGA